MGVIVADSTNASYDGNLSTANGFYRAEAHNLGFVGTSIVNLNTTVGTASPIPVTFANAGNQKGIVLALYTSNGDVNGSNYGVTILLQEYVATVWTTRTTDVFTDAHLHPTTAMKYGTWIVPFKLTTYAVDTTASKWRYLIYKTGGSGGNIQMITSDNTNPFYVAWLDNQVSYASGDQPVCVDTVVIDQTATFTGTLGTGVTSTSTAAIVCRGDNLSDTTTLAKLKWLDTPAASYTLTIDGVVFMTTGGAFRIGTEANPIPFSEQAIVIFKTATVGTAASGFRKSGIDAYERPSFFMYGETPSVRICKLASNAASAQAAITLDNASTGWAIGDRISIGKENRQSNPDSSATYVINTISGANVTLTTNLNYNRLTGASVFKHNGYGIELKNDSSTTKWGLIYYLRSIYNHLVIKGVSFFNVLLSSTSVGNSGIGSYVEQAAYTTTWYVEDCVYYGTVTDSSVTHWLVISNSTQVDLYVNDCYCNGLAIQFGQVYGSTIGTTYIDGFVRVGRQNTSVHRLITDSGYGAERYVVTNSRFENGGLMLFTMRTTDLVFENNYVHGFNTGLTGLFFENGGMRNSGLASIKNNTYEYCARLWYFYPGAYCYPMVEKNSTFINCNEMFRSSASCAVDFEFENCTWTTVEPTVNLATTSVNRSKVRVSNWNNTLETTVYNVYGKTVRTGDGLTDTTVRTAGANKFGIRFESTSSTTDLEWAYTVPTGNIEDKTMVVSAWCKIASATYYAGTHQNPRLTITYDNGTVAYAQATDTTAWQLLSVPFTPTTDFGQITVALTTRTDATTTNAYVYFDDFSVMYPPSVSLDLGGMDNWAGGFPVTPPIALPISAGTVAQGVWQQLSTTSWGTSTMGEKCKKPITYIIDGQIPI